MTTVDKFYIMTIDSNFVNVTNVLFTLTNKAFIRNTKNKHRAIFYLLSSIENVNVRYLC